MDREEFYDKFRALLRKLKPGRQVPDPAPDTHLWEGGYLDSFAMMEVILFLEEELQVSVALAPDTLPSFFTMARVYDTYLASQEPA